MNTRRELPNHASDSLSKRIKETRQRIELAQLESRLAEVEVSQFSRLNLPIIESPLKYGDPSVFDVKGEDRGEILQAITGKRPRRQNTSTHTDKAKRGAEIAQYDQELRHIAQAAKGKRNYDETLARKDFPDFELWKALDDSHLSTKRRRELFSNAYQNFGDHHGRFVLIGELIGVAPPTAYDYYKARPNRDKRAHKLK